MSFHLSIHPPIHEVPWSLHSQSSRNRIKFLLQYEGTQLTIVRFISPRRRLSLLPHTPGGTCRTSHVRETSLGGMEFEIELRDNYFNRGEGEHTTYTIYLHDK